MTYSIVKKFQVLYAKRKNDEANVYKTLTFRKYG